MKRVLLAAIAAAAASSHAIAHGEGDVWVYLDAGRLHTGLISEDGLIREPDVRVFGAEFGGAGIPDFADEPGFQAPDGSFLPSSKIGFNILRALRSWNGSDFGAVSAATITMSFGPLTATTPGTDILTPGFDLTIDDQGGLHDHPDYTLNSPAGMGIYLLELEFTTDLAGVGTSAPFWIVFNNGMDEAEHDAAIEWVEENLVPAPGAACLLAFGALTTLRRRR